MRLVFNFKSNWHPEVPEPAPRPPWCDQCYLAEQNSKSLDTYLSQYDPNDMFSERNEIGLQFQANWLDQIDTPRCPSQPQGP